MTGKVFLHMILFSALIGFGFLPLKPAAAMDGVCVSSPAECAAAEGYSPPATNYYSPRTYYWGPSPQYEPPPPSPAERKATAANGRGKDFLDKSNKAMQKGDRAEGMRLIEKAIKEFKMAIQHNPGKQIYWDNLKTTEALKASGQATVYFYQRKLSLAVQEFRRSAKLWPPTQQGYAEAQENVRMMERILKSEEAKSAGMAYLKQRDFTKAIKEFRRAVDLATNGYEPEKSQFRQLLAEAEIGLKADKEIRVADKFLQRGRPDQAATYYQRALKASPDDDVAKQGLQEAQQMMAAQEEGERRDDREASGRQPSREDGARDGGRPAAGDRRAAETREPRQKIVSGKNNKALDQLISTNEAEREAAGTPSNTKRKERSGDPYDRGGEKYTGSIPTDAVDTRHAGSRNELEESPLPPAVVKALEKDREYQKLSISREAAAKDVRAAQDGIEKMEKRISRASDADRAKLQVELVNLRDKETAAKSKQAAAAVQMKDKEQKLISITQTEEAD